MKYIFPLFLFFLTPAYISAQQDYLDSLQDNLSHSKKEDTIRVLALSSLADYYGFIQFDSCLFYSAQTLRLSQKLNYPYGKFLGYLGTFHGLNSQGNYPMALEAALNIRKTGEELRNVRPWVIAWSYYFRGLLNREMADYPDAIDQFHQSLVLQERSGAPLTDVASSYSQLALTYRTLNKLDSALWYARKGYELSAQSINWKKYFPLAIGVLGIIHLTLHNYDSARQYFHFAVRQSALFNNSYFQARNYNNLASLFDITNSRDSCIYYAGIALSICRTHKFAEYTIDASKILTHVYESEGKSDSVLKYLKIMLVAKDSVFSQSRGRQFQQISFNEIQRLQEINTAKERYQHQQERYALLAALGVFSLIGFIFYRNTREKQKAKVKIEKAYEELKSTQAQLIQSEKMASLGELTAGIAHEIQNPLNFVNNFSEVNKELISELNNEIESGNFSEVKSIAKDIEANEDKINHHGKRADAIVKGMLQHSRTGTGQKEYANINAMADDCLRISYHGLRAREKNFQVNLQTDFEQNMRRILIIPQDLVRVFLNLFNNAFYAVNEKSMPQREDFEPTVSVSTRIVNGKMIIRVKDNGNGISQKIMDKIFQPFFTTKPAGQGTGLGLSMSYDIIKAHGGEIKVETKEGEFTEFVVQIPAV